MDVLATTVRIMELVPALSVIWASLFKESIVYSMAMSCLSRPVWFFIWDQPKDQRTNQGPINKAIHDSHLNERPIVKFNKIDCPDFPVLPEEVQKELSTDQLYLYDICHGLISGDIDESLAARSIGEQIQSRWLNSGSAIGRHYASEEKPSKHLIALTNIMVKSYAKMYFKIKCSPKAIDGPRHIFEMIAIARTFPKEDKEVLSSVFSGMPTLPTVNGFFSQWLAILIPVLEKGLWS